MNVLTFRMQIKQICGKQTPFTHTARILQTGKNKKEVLHWYFFPYQTVHCQLFERNHKIRQAALRRKAQLLAQTIAGSIDTSHGDVHQLRNLLCRQIEPEQCAQTQIAGSQVRELLFQVSEEVLVDAVKLDWNMFQFSSSETIFWLIIESSLSRFLRVYCPESFCCCNSSLSEFRNS